MRTPTLLLDAAATLLLGAACAGCGVPARGLCPACRAVLADPRPRPVPSGVGVPVWASASYDDPWRAAIVAYKERRAWHLARPLGDALAVAVAAALAAEGASGPVVLVPMPSRPAAVRERGLDTLHRMTRRAASELRAAGLPIRVEQALAMGSGVADQGGLGEADRWRNMAAGLVVRPGGPGTRVLVDDITTTGASLGAASEALAAVGTPAVAAAVVAATPRRDGRGPARATHREMPRPYDGQTAGKSTETRYVGGMAPTATPPR